MTDARRFEVHAIDDPRHAGHTVEATGYEDAALTFVDNWHPPADADGEVSVMVTDCETGRRQCLRVDVGEGVTGPCD